MKNKRGQFYIIAAVIIVITFSSIMGIYTSAKTFPEPKTINDLSSDLKEEGPRIVDYGIYNNKDINNLVYNFSGNDYANYFLEKTTNANLVIIYGNKTSLEGIRYSRNLRGSISTTLGGEVTWQITGPYTEKTAIQIDSNENNIMVNILNQNYSFMLRNNEMFYFVMIDQENEEVYVKQNQ